MFIYCYLILRINCGAAAVSLVYRDSVPKGVSAALVIVLSVPEGELIMDLLWPTLPRM